MLFLFCMVMFLTHNQNNNIVPNYMNNAFLSFFSLLITCLMFLFLFLFLILCHLTLNPCPKFLIFVPNSLTTFLLFLVP